MASPHSGTAQARPGTIRLLFVCLGNICRSPTAEGVMRSLVQEAGLGEEIELDSAGTGAWHLGSAPDERASAAASNRGVTLQGSARQVRSEDFEEFDLLIAMDSANLRDLRALAHGERQRAKVRLLREFDPASAAAHANENTGMGVGGEAEDLDVLDPYYGPGDGFAEVFELVRAACEGLLAQIRDGQLP